MPNIFEIAARKSYRFPSKVGALTTEQLFGLPLTTTVGNKASLNDTAIQLADQLDSVGARSFVTTAATNPARADLEIKLDIVKFVIADREAINAAERAAADKRLRRQKLLDAIDAAETRELGSKSADALRAELATLD